MPLIIITQTDEGFAELHLSYASSVDPAATQGDTQSEIFGDWDEDTENAAIELGFEPSNVFTMHQAWLRSAENFLSSKTYLSKFLDALKLQGVESLSIEHDDLQYLFADTAALIIAGESDIEAPDLIESAEELLSILDRQYPDHRRLFVDGVLTPRGSTTLMWPAHAISIIVDSAVHFGDREALRAAARLSKQKIYQFDTGAGVSKDIKWDGRTKAKLAIKAVLYVLDSVYAQWHVNGTAEFTDVGLENWDVAADEPTMETYTDEAYFILETFGKDYENIDLVQDRLEDAEPEVNYPDHSGRFAVFINKSLYGRYEYENDAIDFAKMSREVDYRSGGGYARVYEINDDDFDDDDFDDDMFEEDDISNWTEIF